MINTYFRCGCPSKKEVNVCCGIPADEETALPGVFFLALALHDITEDRSSVVEVYDCVGGMESVLHLRGVSPTSN